MFLIYGCDVYEALSRHAAKPAFMLMLLCSANAMAQPECGQSALVAPATEAISDTRPRIEWAPVPGARHYQVWVESRVPEGRVLFAQEAQTTATYWQPSQPLADYKANVKIRVQANCGGAIADQEKRKQFVSRFRIDASTVCVMPEAPSIKLTQQGIELSWRELPDARMFEVSAFPEQGSESAVVRSETTRTSVRLERPANGIWTIGVRPRCANGYGAYRFQTLNVI